MMTRWDVMTLMDKISDEHGAYASSVTLKKTIREDGHTYYDVTVGGQRGSLQFNKEEFESLQRLIEEMKGAEE